MQKWIWGVLLGVLLVFEVAVARKPLPPALDANTVQALHAYWQDQTPDSQRRWEQAKAASDAKVHRAKAVRTGIMIVDGLCIVVVGFLFWDSVRA